MEIMKIKMLRLISTLVKHKNGKKLLIEAIMLDKKRSKLSEFNSNGCGSYVVP